MRAISQKWHSCTENEPIFCDPTVKLTKSLSFWKTSHVYTTAHSNSSHELFPNRLTSVLSRDQISNGTIIFKYILAQSTESSEKGKKTLTKKMCMSMNNIFTHLKSTYSRQNDVYTVIT